MKIHDYMGYLKDKRYTVFVVTQGNIKDLVDKKLQQEMQTLGFTADLIQMTDRTYYYGAETPLGKKEEMSGEALQYKGSIRKGKSVYSVTAASNVSSVQIDGKEYVSSARGIHIVVYDNDREQVVDSVCFSRNSDGTASASR